MKKENNSSSSLSSILSQTQKQKEQNNDKNIDNINQKEKNIGKKKREKKEKKINRKKYERLIKKEKRIDRRNLLIFIILTIMIAAIISLYSTIKPFYKETSEAMFDALSTMDENTFLRAGNTEIYDTNGNIIGRIGNEKYEYIDISDISPYVTKGYIAKEDRNFTMHNGVDIKGTLRAVVSLIKTKGKITQGGSTITQQVIKNNLLTQEQTYKRKITEIFLAFGLEKEYNKAQIMEFYCNSNYYGNGCYGIEGASEYYFGCKASELTLAEAAILVATSNSPNAYNPVTNYELSMQKKVDVLDDMLECEYITQEEYDEAVEEQPTIVQKTSNVANENYLITYAINSAALKLMEYDGFEFKYTFETSDEYKEYNDNYNVTYNQAVETIRTGGYKIYTSLDPDIQDLLQSTIDDELSEFTEQTDDGIYTLQSAAVCVDNETEMVVAIVGGREEKGSYNRGYQAKRQSGSAIKPLLDYGPAFNEGYLTPASILEDKALDINGYKPKNAWSGYVGDIDVRTALLKSYNTIAVQAFQLVGQDTALTYLDKLHFSSLTYSDMVNTSISIGGFTNGVTVVDMAKGYSTLANGGEYSDNNCIKQLISYNNDVIYEASTEKEEVYNQDTAFMITDILQGMFQESSSYGYKYKKSNQYYVGKTGTTNDNKDAWFCGYSQYYTTAVWIGYDTPKEMDGISGGTYPCKIWTNFMDKLHDKENLSPKDFEAPSTIKLENSSGTRKDVDYTNNIYKSRPDGWDYVSTILEEKQKEKDELAKEEQLEKKAEEKVSEFEDFQITTVEEALEITDLYYDAYNLANEVNDSTIRANLLERIAYKYELLNNDVIDKWNEAIEAYNQNIQKQKDEENQLEAQKSIELAQESTKTSKIELVEYYINLLNERTVYTDYVETLIQNAQNALDDCVDYNEEYQQLSLELEDAIEKARLLPTENKNTSNSNNTTNNSNTNNANNNNSNNSNSNSNSNNNDDTLDISPSKNTTIDDTYDITN